MGLKAFIVVMIVLVGVFETSGEEVETPANTTDIANIIKESENPILNIAAVGNATGPEHSITEISATEQTSLEHERHKRAVRRNKKHRGAKKNKSHKTKTSFWDRKKKDMDQMFKHVDTGLHVYEVLTDMWDRVHPDLSDSE